MRVDRSSVRCDDLFLTKLREIEWRHPVFCVSCDANILARSISRDEHARKGSKKDQGVGFVGFFGSDRKIRGFATRGGVPEQYPYKIKPSKGGLSLDPEG